MASVPPFAPPQNHPWGFQRWRGPRGASARPGRHVARARLRTPTRRSRPEASLARAPPFHLRHETRLAGQSLRAAPTVHRSAKSGACAVCVVVCVCVSFCTQPQTYVRRLHGSPRERAEGGTAHHSTTRRGHSRSHSQAHRGHTRNGATQGRRAVTRTYD